MNSQHQYDLQACGVPREVAKDAARWNYAVLHGYDEQSGWDVSWLSIEDAQRLLELLDGLDAPGHELIHELRRRVSPSR